MFQKFVLKWSYDVEGPYSEKFITDGNLASFWYDHVPAWVMLDLLQETVVTRVILVGKQS